MKLDSHRPKPSIRAELRALNWSTESYFNCPQQELQDSTWVELLVEPPSAFCSDVALLLCQESEGQWLAWIPDYGEIKLYTGQFRKAD